MENLINGTEGVKLNLPLCMYGQAADSVACL